MFLIPLILSLFLIVDVAAAPKLMMNKTTQVCVPHDFAIERLVLKGKIKDFHFTKTWYWENSNNLPTTIENVEVPTQLEFSYNIEDIEPGGLIFDTKGTLVAKMGSNVVSTAYIGWRGVIHSWSLNVEEVYCLPSPEEGLPQTVGSKSGATSSS